MPQHPSSTSSWGAWGQSGRRPEFDSSKYGKRHNSKRFHNNSFATHMDSTPPVYDTVLDPLPAQNPTAAFGDGLVKPVSAATNTTTNDILGNSSINTAVPKLTETEVLTTKPFEDMASDTTIYPKPPPYFTPVAKMAKPPAVVAQSSSVATLPHWGRGASEPPKAMSTISQASSTTPSQAHAAPRAFRPSIGRYQQGVRESRQSRDTPPKIATPKAQVSYEDFQRERMKTLEGVDRRINERRQKKYATANSVLLRKIRQPMSAEKEKAAHIQIQRYQMLGESPSNWPVVDGESEPGSASEAFARSREELRTQGLRADGREQPDDQLKDRKANGDKKNDSEHITWHQATAATAAKPKGNPRWATVEEIKPEAHEVDSNAWGSVNPDDATHSGDSLRAIHDGAIGRPIADGPDPGLVGWDGKLVEAPADWEGRPRSHAQKYYPGYGDFGQFLDNCFHQQYPGTTFAAMPLEVVMDLDLHADGIGMAPRTQTMTLRNLGPYFGYSDAMISEVAQFLQGTTDTEFDGEEPLPTHALDEIGYVETSEVYSQRFMVLEGIRATSNTYRPTTPPAVAEVLTAEVPIKTPAVSVYLRPAALADVPQLVEIYNWHIENGPRPTEMSVISEVDMHDRFDDAVNHKLPFIVAAEKVKTKRRGRGSNKFNHAGSVHPMQNANPGYQAIVAEEKIVGWSSAADWSASDYVERISAEIEIYVDSNYRMTGVGRCLMDKMLQICDRGYIPKGGYDFHCLPETTYMYSGGGARDLHKIWFIVRTWSKPVKTPEIQKLFKASDREDEVDIWLKSWLESMDFEQEGRLKQVGAKNGRFLDQLQFGRVTMWQPQDGEIPDPLPGTT